MYWTIIKKIGLLLAATIFALLVCEGIVRIFSLDWRFIQKALPYMTHELEVHELDPDPSVITRLKPNSTGTYQQMYGEFTVKINALGHRDPARSITKPKGVFRILCVGGSNVYGAGINNEQTWPAQLEDYLNKSSTTRYEVWNLGVSGYNSLQMSAISKHAIEKYDPDLLIFALTNMGPRFFLKGTGEIDYYFKKDPTLWAEIFPESFFRFPTWISTDNKKKLLSSVALYRLVLSAKLSFASHVRFMIMPFKSPYYVETSRNFLKEAAAKIKVAVFICPGVIPNDLFKAHYDGLEVPVFTLSAQGKPESFKEIHPPAQAMSWYAKNLASWLKENDLLLQGDLSDKVR